MVGHALVHLKAFAQFNQLHVDVIHNKHLTSKQSIEIDPSISHFALLVVLWTYIVIKALCYIITPVAVYIIKQ